MNSMKEHISFVDDRPMVPNANAYKASRKIKSGPPGQRLASSTTGVVQMAFGSQGF